MAWDWIETGAKRLQELGGEYKQHHALIERLLTLDPVAAQLEVARVWPTLDDRARAAVRMTLAALTLSHQAASANAAAAQRAERLKALHASIEQASAANQATGHGAEAAVTAGAARVAQTLAGAAERARPKAEEIIESARQGVEKYAPAAEAAVTSVINDLLKVVPRRAPDPSHGGDKGPALAGHWVGTLRRAGTTDTLGCDLHVATSGRPLWAYHDADGFHTVELAHEGQTIQYVPPDRGVVTVTVQSVTGSATQTGYVVDYSLERASNGYLTQRYQRIALAGQLRGTQLDVIYSEAGTSSFGDKIGMDATEASAEYSGSLTKQG
jgi:hypothetical protein